VVWLLLQQAQKSIFTEMQNKVMGEEIAENLNPDRDKIVFSIVIPD